MPPRKVQKQNNGISKVKEFLDSYLGEVVDITKPCWNHTINDYLFHQLTGNKYEVYTTAFLPKDIEKIVITTYRILIVLKEKVT